jgi:lysophospholipase L1-like esterase
MKPAQAYSVSISVGVVIILCGFVFSSSAIKQIGTLVTFATILYTPVLFLRQNKQAAVHECMKRVIPGFFVFIFIFFAAGEIALRIWFFNGASFGRHIGPIVERFERNFQYNRFDGKSRGPEISGPKTQGAFRVIVQGDSITWGQGIKNEQDLYTTRLLSMLQRDRPVTEMAVMASPGRELDGHLVQLAKWGKEIDPDVIIYQFYSNDLDLEKKFHPSTQGIWQRVFFYRTFVTKSYFGFFLDYALSRWTLDDRKKSYLSYMLNQFGSDTKAWKRSRSVFQAWVREAKRLTPNVLIICYPRFNSQGNPTLLPVYKRVLDLCEEQALEVLDLRQAFGDMQGEVDRIRSGSYDMHPSAELHRLMADAVYRKLKQIMNRD